MDKYQSLPINITDKELETEFQSLVGKSLELIEAVGLPSKQETAIKKQLKRIIYTSYDNLSGFVDKQLATIEDYV